MVFPILLRLALVLLTPVFCLKLSHASWKLRCVYII